MTDDGRRGYVLTEDDVNSIADLVTAGDPRAMQVPNGAVAALITMLREVESERDEAQRRFDAFVTTDKAKQGAADWMLNRLHDDRLIDNGTYRSLCGLLRDQIDATRNWTHSEDWGPLRDRLRAALKRTKEAEAKRDAMQDLLGSIWLYVGWRSATRSLTTEQRELWANAVDADVRKGQIEDGEEPHPVAERWWRDDFVEDADA